jgi:hypothetical protein
VALLADFGERYLSNPVYAELPYADSGVSLRVAWSHTYAP